MKKRRPPDQSEDDFKNKPFKLLRGLAPSAALPAKKRTTPQASGKVQNNSEDDASLFFRAAEGARKIGNASDVRDGSGAARGREKTMLRVSEESQLFLAAVQKIGKTPNNTAVEHEREEAERRSSASRLRQLKRGEIRISRELDLHGYLRDEALKRLEPFLAAAWSNGEQAVLVITGKGINSLEGPVLQGAVADWLRTKGKGIIAEFSRAPRDRGGSGAFVVFLQQK